VILSFPLIAEDFLFLSGVDEMDEEVEEEEKEPKGVLPS